MSRDQNVNCRLEVHSSAFSAATDDAHSHTHSHSHSHGTSADHGHTHEHMENAGSFQHRPLPSFLDRQFAERSFTVGIGGPVGSGKTALMLALCRSLYPKLNIAVVTNDIFTREDAEFLIKHEALPEGRIVAVETGGCPHAAIRGTEI